ncbi:MAG: hypothetical protein R2818_11920 [Flavobacteriales bacterium]
MGPHRLALLCACTVLGMASFAQSGTGEAVRPLVGDAYVIGGAVYSASVPLGLADWKAVLPDSRLLQKVDPNAPGADYNYYLPEYQSATGMFEMGVGLDLGRKRPQQAKVRQQLRISATYVGADELTDAWRRSLTGPYDTLVSQQTGEEILFDTTWSERTVVSARFSRIGIAATYLLIGNNASRWKWNIGAGGSLGTTLNVQGNVDRFAGSGNRPYDQYYYGVQLVESESFRIGSSIWGSVHGVFGLDYRLSKAHPFWSTLNLHYELRPAIQFGSVPGADGYAYGTVQQLFGLRIDLR